MSSALYKNPYETGKAEGIEEGIVIGKEKGKAEGKMEAKYELAETLLTKKFGVLPARLLKKLKQANLYYLNVIIEKIFDLASLDDVESYLDLSE